LFVLHGCEHLVHETPAGVGGRGLSADQPSYSRHAAFRLDIGKSTQPETTQALQSIPDPRGNELFPAAMNSSADCELSLSRQGHVIAWQLHRLETVMTLEIHK